MALDYYQNSDLVMTACGFVTNNIKDHTEHEFDKLRPCDDCLRFCDSLIILA